MWYKITCKKQMNQILEKNMILIETPKSKLQIDEFSE